MRTHAVPETGELKKSPELNTGDTCNC